MPVNIIGTLKPKNNGKFPVAEAVDIKVTDDLRLDEALEKKADLETLDFALNNKADKATTTSLQSQINEIITPVTQDAEVQNARVGSDGTSYTTLKERLDTENTSIQGNITELEEWIGYAPSYIDATKFTITNTSNWSIEAATKTSIEVEHKTEFGTGFPKLTVDVEAGTYIFNADFSQSSVKYFGLYIDGSYSQMLNTGDIITIEDDKTYEITFMPSDIGTYIVTDITLINTSPNGKIQEIENELSIVNQSLSNLPFAKVYKAAPVEIQISSCILPSGAVSSGLPEGYTVTDYFELNTDKVRVTASANWGNNYYAFYDKNKTFISGEASSSSGSTITEIVNEIVNVPANAKYIRVAAITTKNNISLDIYTDELVIENILPQSSLDEKTWCVIGDSLTEANNQATSKYYDYLAYPTTTIANLGKSGTGFLQTYNTYENYVDRVDDLTGEEAYDVISVMGGINDSGHIGTDYQLGQLGDTEPTTIYGAIYYVFNSLITKFPLAFIFAITEPVTGYRYELGNNIDVIQQAVREVCAWLKIPVADINKNASMRPWIADFAEQYYHDNTHPNSAGHEIMAKAMTDIFKYM